ncbi:MAG: thermonuclease family protein [Alphaproteobacteria bacterium]
MKRIIIFVAINFLFISHAFAKPRILDGDSFFLSKNEEIRLVGLDAPEYKQICYDTEGKEYDCGQKAKKALIKIIGKKNLDCHKIKRDIYKRYLSECFVGDVNVNLEMLRQGWAVLYRSKDKEYVAAQEYAKENKLGVWQGKFMKPELYRALNRK